MSIKLNKKENWKGTNRFEEEIETCKGIRKYRFLGIKMFNIPNSDMENRTRG